MPQVGFELTIPAFERAKTVHALDRAATVIGSHPLTRTKFKSFHHRGNLIYHIVREVTGNLCLETLRW
jgi:hypothetical protein